MHRPHPPQAHGIASRLSGDFLPTVVHVDAITRGVGEKNRGGRVGRQQTESRFPFRELMQ